MAERKDGREGEKSFLSFAGFFLKILVVAVFVAGTVAIIRPLHSALLERMERGRDVFFSRLEEYWGRRIQYSSMGPSVFGALDIRDVRILREDDSVLLSIARIRLSYSLISLVRGNIFDSFHSVRLDQPVLNLDVEKDADIVERFALSNNRNGQTASSPQSAVYPASAAESAPASPQARITIEGLRELLPEGFSLRVWNGTWDIAGSAGSVALQGFDFGVSMSSESFRFQGGWNASAAMNGELGLSAAMAARISGEYMHESGEGSVTLAIPSFGGEYVKVSPLSFTFLLSNGAIEGQKSHGSSQASGQLFYDFEMGKFSSTIEGNNFPLSELLSFSGPWADYAPLQGILISGSASFELERSGLPVYSILLSGFRPGETPDDEAALSLDLRGIGGDITVGALELQSSNGNVSFHGGMDMLAAAPYGELFLANFSRSQDIPGVSGTFTLGAHGREITLSGHNLSAAGDSLQALDAALSREDGGFTFYLSALAGKSSGGIGGSGGAMLIQGSVDNSPRQFRTTLLMDSFPIAGLFSFVEPIMPLPERFAPLRTAATGTSVTTESFFAAYGEHILYNVPSLTLVHSGGPNDIAASVSFAGTERRFDLSTGRVTWKGESADIVASADFANPDDVTFSFSATYQDLMYYIGGSVTERRHINAAGSYGFMLDINSAEDGSRRGYAQAENIPFASGNGHALLSFLFSLQHNSADSWEAAIERFEISGLATPASSSASLHVTGFANESALNIPVIVFNDGLGTLQGSLSADWDFAQSRYTFEADMRGNSLSELYIVNGAIDGGRLELDFSGYGMQLRRASAYDAVADAGFRLSWESINSFLAEAELSSLIMRDGNETLVAAASASVNQETFSLRNVSASYAGLQASVPNLTIDRASSQAYTRGVIQGSLYERPVDIAFRSEVSFSAAQTWAQLLRGFDRLEGSLAFDTAKYYTQEAQEPFSFEFASLRQQGGGFSVNVSGGPQNMLRFMYSPADNPALSTGTFFAALSSPSPVRGSIAGSMSAATIDAHMPDLYVDLESLSQFMPPDLSVYFPAGFVSGSVRIVGPLADPGFYGSVIGTGVHIVVPEFIPQPIRPVPVTFLLNGSEMSFGPIFTEVGRGGGMASAEFVFDRWVPDTFSIDIQVPQETPIPYGFDIDGLFAGGLVSGRLALAMEEKLLSVTGALMAHNTEISLGAAGFFAEGPLGIFGNEPFGIGTAATMPMTISRDSESVVDKFINLSIRSGRRVEFFWPSVNFPMLQATATMGSLIHITSETASGSFNLTGDVDLRSGEIFYLERNFYIREGTLFFNENETEFNPRITARAEIREVSESGPVTISMIIENEPLMSFSPRFVSNPPLSPIEVFSILGQVPREGEAARNVGMSAALDTLAQFSVMRRIQRQARDLLGLDMLSIRTQVINNVLFPGVVNQSGEDTGLTPARPNTLGNYFDNTTVFIGRYFGNVIFAQAMLTVKYDEFRTSAGGVMLEPELGFEMRGPLFDVRFNMIPLNPENWFIEDTSISFLMRMEHLMKIVRG